MKKAIRLIFFLLWVSPVFFLPTILAAEETGTDQSLRELNAIKERLANIEKQQQEISDKDKEILEKLDQLRVWVHRK